MHKLLKIMVLLCLFGCANSADDDGSPKVEEIRGMDYKELIKIPMNNDGTVDTSDMAKIVFEEMFYDFGQVNEGDTVKYTFIFENRGKQALLLQDVRSTCGCTIPEWSKTPIQPGGRSTIKVRFNTDGKINKQYKPITITANTYPSKTKLHISGFVKPKAL